MRLRVCASVICARVCVCTSGSVHPCKVVVLAKYFDGTLDFRQGWKMGVRGEGGGAWVSEDSTNSSYPQLSIDTKVHHAVGDGLASHGNE